MTAPILTRAQLRLRGPRSISTNIAPTEGCTLHYGGDAVGGFPWDHSRCPSIWRAWQAFHMDTHGWSDIAYNGGICPHGFILEGRWLGVRSAAQGTNEGNLRSYALVYLGGVGEALTDAAKIAFLDAIEIFRHAASRPAGAPVHDHRDWHSTSCPGDDLLAWHRAGLPRPGLQWSPPAQSPLAAPVAAIRRTPSGQGYTMFAEDGGVFCFGDAMFFGSLPGLGVKPNGPVVDAQVSGSGGGYTMLSADGGIFTFGDALFCGSLGGQALNAFPWSLDLTLSNAGYWIAARDGGLFSFGDAPFYGSAA